jgi:integrating conjugative element protein (TIGR03749 family)
MERFIFVALAIVIVTFSFVSHSTEIIHYDKKPITIQLHKGQERTIHFGDHVSVGVTKGMKQKNLFRVQSAQGSLHLRANDVFDKQRVQVKRLSDSHVILLDLISTDSKGSLEDVKVIMPFENKIESMDGTSLATEPENIQVITPVHLTRYASQKLYGPTRLQTQEKGITSTPLGVKGEVKLFKGENKINTYSTPLIAYQGGGYYITALHIKNTKSKKVKLSYLDLNLPFTHATFQHHSLMPKGTVGDSTVLYLISDKPMKETLYPWSYFTDLKAEQAARTRDKQ